MVCSGQEIQHLAVLPSGANGYYVIVSAVPEFRHRLSRAGQC
jgi:hypothetical protein